jgi:hypothetical protein
MGCPGSKDAPGLAESAPSQRHKAASCPFQKSEKNITEIKKESTKARKKGTNPNKPKHGSCNLPLLCQGCLIFLSFFLHAFVLKLWFGLADILTLKLFAPRRQQQRRPCPSWSCDMCKL